MVQIDFSLFNLAKTLGRAGVPMEVMGLMLGEFVDEYTVRVIDVFAMPQSGTGNIFLKFLKDFIFLLLLGWGSIDSL